MQLKYPDPKVVCDNCGQAEAESEDAAKAEGWVIGYDSDPHTHVCPACQAATA